MDRGKNMMTVKMVYRKRFERSYKVD